ncbi:spectrin beta chain, non-erythrocytic 1 isoform X1 [Tachysurus ichikawai]
MTTVAAEYDHMDIQQQYQDTVKNRWDEEWDNENSSARLFERSRIKALAGLLAFIATTRFHPSSFQNNNTGKLDVILFRFYPFCSLEAWYIPPPPSLSFHLLHLLLAFMVMRLVTSLLNTQPDRASGEITTQSPPPIYRLLLDWPNKGALCWREALSLV